MLRQSRFTRKLIIIATLFVTAGPAAAQVPTGQTRRLITQPIDESTQVELPGNIRPEATIANDRGSVPASFLMEHMQLDFRLPKEKQEELDRLVREIEDPTAPEYHKWITSEEFRQKFSVAPEDVETISTWLSSKGFKINAIGATLIDFTGTAAQVRNAFKTDIHYLNVRGVRHIANMQNPQIPAALAPAVAGIGSLNDFRPRPLNHVY
jgi:hypothetical protein